MTIKAVRDVRKGELVVTAVGVRCVLRTAREHGGIVRLTYADGSALYASGKKITVVN